MAVQVAPNDGKSHTVQIYSDITAEWVSGSDSALVNWTTTTHGAVLIHKAQLQRQTLFDDSADRIQREPSFWCRSRHRSRAPRGRGLLRDHRCTSLLLVAYYSQILILALQSANVTFQTGQDIAVRGQFLNHGALLNTQDTSYRAISDDWPVFAFAHDLGAISASERDTAVFSVGHARDPVINYTLGHGNYQYRHPYFLSRYETVEEAVSVNEYPCKFLMLNSSRCSLRPLSKTTRTLCLGRTPLTHASMRRRQ